jgi:DNA invertase Pin-like site-specific DNA recombinase
MTPIKHIVSGYSSVNQAAQALDIFPMQLHRWLNNNALVDDTGAVWIKTGKPIKMKNGVKLSEGSK